MSKLLYIMLLFIVFINNSKVSSQDLSNPIEGVKLIISTDKINYLEGEVIWRECKLVVDKSVKLDYKPVLGSTLDLQENIKNSKNIYMPYTGGCYHSIGKQKEYSDTIYDFDILNFGTFENAPSAIYYIESYLPADEYEFSASVKVSINEKIFNVEAEPYRFSVYKPEGEENLARQSYFNFIPMVFRDSPNLKEIADSFESFMKKFPNSVYIDRVLRLTEMLYFTYTNKTIDEKIEFQLNIINKYPFFSSNYERLRSIVAYCEIKKDANGFLDMINNLESKYQNDNILKKVIFHIRRAYVRELQKNKFY